LKLTNLTLLNESYDGKIPTSRILKSVKTMLVELTDYHKTLDGLPRNLERLSIVYLCGYGREDQMNGPLPKTPLLNGLPQHLSFTITRYDYPIANLPDGLVSFKIHLIGNYPEDSETQKQSHELYDFNHLPMNLSHLSIFFGLSWDSDVPSIGTYMYISGEMKRIPNSVEILKIKGSMMNVRFPLLDDLSSGLKKLVISIKPVLLKITSIPSLNNLPKGLLYLKLKNQLVPFNIAYPQSLKTLITDGLFQDERTDKTALHVEARLPDGLVILQARESCIARALTQTRLRWKLPSNLLVLYIMSDAMMKHLNIDGFYLSSKIPDKLIALKLPEHFHGSLSKVPNNLRILKLNYDYEGHLDLDNTRVQSLEVTDNFTYNLPQNLYELVCRHGTPNGKFEFPKNLHTLIYYESTIMPYVGNFKNTSIKEMAINCRGTVGTFYLPDELEKLSLTFYKIHVGEVPDNPIKRMIPKGLLHLTLNIPQSFYFDLRELPIGLTSLAISNDLFKWNVDVFRYHISSNFLNLRYFKVGEFLKFSMPIEGKTIQNVQLMSQFKIYYPSLYSLKAGLSNESDKFLNHELSKRI